MIGSKFIQRYGVHAVVLFTVILFSGGCTDKTANADQFIAKAKQERDKGNNKAAVVYLKDLLQKSPEHAEGRYLLGATYNAMGDFRSGESELRRALALNYDKAKVNPALGKSLLMMSEFQKVLDQVPLDGNASNAVQAEILTLRAMASMGLGRSSEARELLTQALAKQPDFPDALLGQARLAASEKKPDEAAQLIDRALVSAPKNAEAWLMKGDLARMKADKAGASAAYQKVIEISPENIPARLNIASIQIDAGNLTRRASKSSRCARSPPIIRWRHTCRR